MENKLAQNSFLSNKGERVAKEGRGERKKNKKTQLFNKQLTGFFSFFLRQSEVEA